MAYSSVRVQFEIGHEASVRTKKTPEGFTHDWEVFVRGADNTDIQYFVEKVVFHLHETFPKPRRVIKEPPYVVKESGYAGFVLPIDVYLKNKEEPKKISFQYDLTLRPSGPPLSRVLREPRLFQNPSEDFRRKLIRGGGVGVDTPSETHADEHKSVSASQNKSKGTESSVKKHKPDLPTNHSFAELFGTPIRRVLEPKKLPELSKKSSEADDKKKLSKHGPYRDEKEKDKYSEKERNKERDKTKEKPGKRPPSPPPPLPQVTKSKEEHKKHEEKEKKKEEHDDKKKRKEEKEKKEKSKEVKEPTDKQPEKEHKKEKKEPKEDYAKKLTPSKSHDVKPVGDNKHNNESAEKEKERPEKEKHKHRHKKKEKEKNRDKEKHRKEKDKSEKDSRERDREKDKTNKKRHEEGREKEEKVRKKSRSPSPIQERVKKGPLNALLNELGSSDSASPLSEEDPIPPFKSFSKPPAKIVPESKSLPVANVIPKLKSTNSISTPTEKETEKTPKSEEVNLPKAKKEKSSSKKNKKLEKDAEKRKAKEESRPRSPSSERDEDEVEKDRPIKEEREKDRLEEEKPKLNKDKENRKRKREKSEEKQTKAKKPEDSVAGSQSAAAVKVPEALEEPRRPDKFTKEYVALLKDLQRRIMTLEDNAELQKVVKVIAETGQYEITTKTFDFDLCALDSETVKRLQEFFAPT